MKTAFYAIFLMLLDLPPSVRAAEEDVHIYGNPEAWRRAVPVKYQKRPEYAFVKADPNLPNVLLIGDSISMQYTVSVREKLAGIANVYRAPDNCRSTRQTRREIEKYLGQVRWDVIHFNFGLHDLKYLGPKGQNLADPKGEGSHQQVQITDYEKNLRTMVARLEKTGAELVWRTTTPVPPGARGRVVGDSVKYNQIALRVMKEHGIAVNDLYRLSIGKLEKIQRPANVHFTPEGSRMLAEQVVKSISSQLKKK